MALERLGQGDTIIFRRLRLRVEGDVLAVAAESTWTTQLTEAHIREDLGRAQDTVRELIANDASLRSVVGERRVAYEVIIDPGMGPVRVAALYNDGLEWAPGFLPSD